MFVIVIIIYSATQMPKLLQDVLGWDGGNGEGALASLLGV